MIKKLPWKNILIVFTAMLVVPVMAFAMTISANPSEGLNDENSNIKITSDESIPDAASAATSVLTAGALGYIDAASSATGQNQNSSVGGTDAISSATSNPVGGTDAVSSATGNPGTTGSLGYDDDQYESDDEDEDEEDEDDD